MVLLEREIEVRYYLKSPYKGDRMVCVNISTPTLNTIEILNAVIEKGFVGEPMLFTGLLDVSGKKMFDKDYIEFTTEGKSVVKGMIRFINQRNKNGFMIVSNKNRGNTWSLNEYFSESIKPRVIGNKMESNI